MLVLGRKKGETIVINDDIEITVTSIEGDMVRLGINAPKQITIHRKEVYLEIQEENKQATSNVINLSDFLSMRKK
ncbi:MULTISPECIES: carbon storage regulator CsrA [Planococcus]|uniref:Translational regulator CsrA n=4 Tax=Planococcus TaxID=1372 RepID=A0ABM6D1T9_9BACL|nr:MULTISPECIES: carbon storage regulator CsrA [Planococcus]AIY04068.1 carbon storage regulator [Planococcus sp. PAMC 21323]ANU09198.1 carbon storage regulator [Planococcus antarcticus DSM 14505]ANU24610.1 carbon storage regulator [Planococcus donghaensis]AQU77965.1 carbon storage regulator [Planococcus faecalis]EGA88993.1 carbon storage regulator, CsrA [Planococcus donghaensis MPA1U2]